MEVLPPNPRRYRVCTLPKGRKVQEVGGKLPEVLQLAHWAAVSSALSNSTDTLASAREQPARPYAVPPWAALQPRERQRQKSTQPLARLGRAVVPSSASEARQNITGKFELPRPARQTRAATDFTWANRVSEPSTPQK